MESVPPHLKAEQQAVEAQIRTAFRHATRKSGVSWSESEVIDFYGSDAEQAIARARDTDESWEELVDDPSWIEEPGVGGFNFLDPIGFRYYIAPAMIRCSRRGRGEFIGYALEIDGAFKENLISLFSSAQAAATARIVRFMIATHAAANDDLYGESWKHSYKTHWRHYDTGDPSEPSLAPRLNAVSLDASMPSSHPPRPPRSPPGSGQHPEKNAARKSKKSCESIPPTQLNCPRPSRKSFT